MSTVSEHKKCCSCQTVKHKDEFYTCKRKYKKKNGEVSIYFILDGRCKSCTKEYTTSLKKTEKYKQWKKEYVQENKDRDNQYRRTVSRSRINAMLNNARRRAKKYNVEFDLNIDDIVIPELCPLLQVPLIWGTKGNYEHTPSLDRIDPLGGYTIDNINIISKKANSMKNSASLDEMKIFHEHILSYMKHNKEDIV